MKIFNTLFVLFCIQFYSCNNDSMIIESVPQTPGLVVDGGAELTFTPEELKFPGKKGIGLSLKEGDANYDRNIARIKELKTYWNYSWNYNYAADQPLTSEYIPMTWGKFEPETFLNAVTPFVESGHVTKVLGFNEPDKEGQADMTVEEALDLWPTLQSLRIPLGAPSVADGRGEWLEQFMQGVEERGYRVDYVCIHIYGSPNPDGLKNYVNDVYNKYKKPIIITEFAPADWSAKNDPSENNYTEEQCLKFMEEVLPWLEEQECVYGYAWFPFEKSSPWGCCSALYKEDGSLTSLGKFYSEFTGEGSGGETEEYPTFIEEDFESADWVDSWLKPEEVYWLSKENGDEGVINGNGSLLMNKVITNDQYSGMSQTVKVEPGKTYEYGFTGRIQTERGESGTGENPKSKPIKMSIKKGPNNEKWLELPCTSTTNTKVKGEITIPDGLTTVNVSIWTSWASAYGYIDDVYFRPKGEGGNSVDIDDFEDGETYNPEWD